MNYTQEAAGTWSVHATQCNLKAWKPSGKLQEQKCDQNLKLLSTGDDSIENDPPTQGELTTHISVSFQLLLFVPSGSPTCWIVLSTFRADLTPTLLAHMPIFSRNAPKYKPTGVFLSIFQALLNLVKLTTKIDHNTDIS